MPKPKVIQFDQEDFHQKFQREDREKAMTLIGISKKDASNNKLSLEEKLNVKHDNSAMLVMIKAKSLQRRQNPNALTTREFQPSHKTFAIG